MVSALCKPLETMGLCELMFFVVKGELHCQLGFLFLVPSIEQKAACTCPADEPAKTSTWSLFWFICCEKLDFQFSLKHRSWILKRSQGLDLAPNFVVVVSKKCERRGCARPGEVSDTQGTMCLHNKIHHQSHVINCAHQMKQHKQSWRIL